MRIHFIAIGGAAMHNLAMAVATKAGYVVTGSDDEIFDPARTHLQEAGLLPEEMGWHPEKITSDIDAIILGMHAREDNPELVRARELGIKIYSFPEYLYEQTKDKIRIVVGGSHGKTSTTSMILYVLQRLGIEADYMVGAQIEGFERMVRLSDTAKYAVFEGDEYLTSPLDLRSKFLWYHPHVAILTGIAWDHINVFPTFDGYVDTFRKFVDGIEENGTFIYYKHDTNLCEIASQARPDIKQLPYEAYQGDVDMKIFGKHNMENLQAAALACEQIGVKSEDFYRTIATFTGASNRLELIDEIGTNVAYKDFAHSPSKLRATVNAVRERYPEKQLVAAMELHTFSSLMADFLPQYDGCMAQADVALVYFNPKVIEHKRLTPITAEEVRKAFGTENVEVFTDSQLLQERLRSLTYENTALLMMTSGTFDGVNIPEFARELISSNKDNSKKKHSKLPYTHCLNCGAELQGKYCHVCGQEATSKTPTVGAFLVEYANHAFIWDSNFLKTIWNLIRRPGHLTKEFIAGKFASHEHPLKLNMFLLFVLITLFVFFAGTEKMNNSVHNLTHNEAVVAGVQIEFMIDKGELDTTLLSPEDTVLLLAPLFFADQHPGFIRCIDTLEYTNDKGLDKWIAVVPHTFIEDSIIVEYESGCYRFNQELKAAQKELMIINSIGQKMVDIIARYFPLLVLFTAPFLAMSLRFVQRKSRIPRIHHFIFALHYTAFLEVIMICIFLLHLTLSPPMWLLECIMVIGSCLYLTIAFRNVYGTSTWTKAMLKALFTSVVYVLIGLGVFLGILIVAFFVAINNASIS